MKLKIHLLSDFCAYSGETFNSYVDMDVVYDDYGFPYIPAKRIKGCLREACLELVEFGRVREEEYHALFGTAGNRASHFSLGNAYLEDYDALLGDIQKNGDDILTHPQRVLGLYTYTRTRTAITPEGTAEKNSLRTLRVVKRGLVFEAELQFTEDAGETERRILSETAGMVKHMGIGRTRGLGLVGLELVESEAEPRRDHHLPEFYAKRNKINYSIYLKSPLLCKSPEGNQAKTQDYIEGSKVLGLLAQLMGNAAFQNMMQSQTAEKGEGLVVSNAYISESGKRCTPVMASLQKKKDQTYTEAGEMQVVDLLEDYEGKEQLTPVGALYVDAEGYVKGVDTEINYHHRRPKDKSVGRATREEDSVFYQLESIRQGQTFRGYILADRGQAEKICETLKNAGPIRMGYGRSAEYGAVELRIDAVWAAEAHKVEQRRDFIVKLNAPAILYNENGCCSSDVAVLRDYLAEVLEAEDLELEKAFLCYETIGGFNVTWNRRKPVFTALGKGTVCRFHTERGADVGRLRDFFIGERVSEGYGELEVCERTDGGFCLKKSRAASGIKEEHTYRTDLIPRLSREWTKLQIEKDARRAGELAVNENNLEKSREIDAVIGKLILISKAETCLDGMIGQIDGIASESKKKLSKTLVNYVQSYVKEKDFGGIESDQIYQIYMQSFLNQIKYQIRPKKNERRN